MSIKIYMFYWTNFIFTESDDMGPYEGMKKLPYDPTKPTLQIENNLISFQQLKQVYKEFQNLVREERKNDTWDEFVNQAQFQVRPDTKQDCKDYVQPNFMNPRTECPKGLL